MYIKTEEHKRNLSKALMGKKHSVEHRRRLGESRRGCKHSKETKEKMSKAQLGHSSRMVGFKHTDEARRKIGIGAKGRVKSEKERRQISERQVGENNPSWLGGISFEPYGVDWTETLKRSIRERDDYTCQICKMTEEEHLIVYGNVLSVHHIDYCKKNCCEGNLISLCLGCNVRVNYNRRYWEKTLTQRLTPTV